MERRYLNVKECAEYAGLSKETIYRFSRSSFMPSHKIRQMIRFDKIEIDNWMKKFKREPLRFELLQNNITK